MYMTVNMTMTVPNAMTMILTRTMHVPWTALQVPAACVDYAGVAHTGALQAHHASPGHSIPKGLTQFVLEWLEVGDPSARHVLPDYGASSSMQ